jgi:phosphohistidine swiveling domain-containing protein
MQKIHLTKEYERDISLIMEAAWAQKLASFVPERLGIKSPHDVFIVFYVTEENLQIWESAEALSWFSDVLLEKNLNDPQFMEKIVLDYGKIIGRMEKFWKNGPTSDKNALEEYAKLLEDGVALFTAWYYPMIDGRTPKDISERLLKLRSTDELFAKNDVFVKDCVEAMGGDRDLANFIFPEEFPNLPDAAVLEARKGGVVSVGYENLIMTLEEFASQNPEYYFEGLAEQSEEVQELRGQSAFPGKAEGRVRIVKNKKQMQKMEAGDILVSPMTTPDFLPAMKMAAAFVTDEGGITCHAAIVSRELKKPCIVGTKIATQVLHDGDLVEVGADKGVVKIIGKN